MKNNSIIAQYLIIITDSASLTKLSNIRESALVASFNLLQAFRK